MELGAAKPLELSSVINSPIVGVVSTDVDLVSPLDGATSTTGGVLCPM